MARTSKSKPLKKSASSSNPGGYTLVSRAIRICACHCARGEGKNTYGESRQVFVCVRNLIPFERA